MRIKRSSYQQTVGQNNIIYIALHTKVLKCFTMEEENRITKLMLPIKEIK